MRTKQKPKENLGKSIDFTLYEAPKGDHKSLHLKISNISEPLWLSDILPVLENMGLRVKAETTTRTKHKQPVWTHDFSLEPKFKKTFTFSKIKEPFETCLNHVWHHKAENNLFNSLILGCGLSWREVMLLQAYFKYLRQLDTTHTLEYVSLAFLNYPKLTRLLLDLFNHQFNPGRPAFKTAQANKLLEQIDHEMDKVTSSDTDKILRCFLQLILGTVRTNYFQEKDYVSFKIDCRLIPFLPQPRPLYEVFVYAAHMEGIHLRGGKISRGGIRWSDRKEDFRTEILDLMKSQMVKNAVIIPDGAKGGFIVKKHLHNLNFKDTQQEAIRCYETLIHGLLDITDSLDHGKIMRPPRVRRLDEDDPYLVVAADKGTGSFSDIANGIAAEYKFWLGDAFASGGSAGYDHKAMGITAKGAWESVKRHFAEMGQDIARKPFTVVGVGDMAGDIFGNGMLMSPNISLRAAFNHQHIFLDPNPDLQNSYQEREILFKKAGSTWADYNSKVLSKGGGIYSRQDKTISISSEAKEVLGLSKTKLTPQELIKGILKAPVDLLWMGGIGTYVKATPETLKDVEDHSNDALRINGSELQCKVVGEGANLGFTQLGRIEYAQKGGRLNTDAIDNSGGVDCSDHEVNIKILCEEIIKAKLLTLETRNTLLESMTQDITTKVLWDNFLQTQIISIEEQEGPRHLQRYGAFMKMLEDQGMLDRTIEGLPSDKILAYKEMHNESLTRPELSVVLAYGKLFAYDKIISTDLPNAPETLEFLENYFPKVLQAKYMPQIHKHPLRRELITTQLANEMVNYLGPCFLPDIMLLTQQPAYPIMETYLQLRHKLNLPSKWKAIQYMNASVTQQYDGFRHITRLLKEATVERLKK